MLLRHTQTVSQTEEKSIEIPKEEYVSPEKITDAFRLK